MKIVIKYGGSLLFMDKTINTVLIDKICKVIRDMHAQGHEVGVVVGGGLTARDYISSLGNDAFGEANKDYVAVMATRLNAMLFISRLNDICYPMPPNSYEQLVEYLSFGKVVISGGMQPGQSTNAVATLFCEAMGAKVLVNATNVDFIYDKDPNKYEDARPLKDINYMKLQQIVSEIDSGAGQYDMFDMVAAKNISRSKIKLFFINGNKPENLLSIVKGKHIGTMVH